MTEPFVFHLLWTMASPRPCGAMVIQRQVEARDRTVRFQETLRRLAIIDESFVEDQARLGLGLAGDWTLDPKTATLLQVAASVATGLGRVVAAAPDVATALGYDIAAALEELDDH